MKRSSIFFMSQLALIFLVFITIVSNTNAELLYEIGKPPPPRTLPPPPSNPGKGSEESGALMLPPLSKLFMSFEALERKNIHKAEELLEEVRAALREATAFYESLQSQTPNRPISTANMTNDEIRIIKKDFELYRSEQIPKSYKELAFIACEEVKYFAEFINKVSFRNDSAKNRKTVRDIVTRLNRYMRLGISIAEIDAANKYE
jgi:hypothetical protein